MNLFCHVFMITVIVHNNIYPYFDTVIKNYDNVRGTIDRSRRKSKSAERLAIFSLRRVGRPYDYKNIYHHSGGSQNIISK